MNDEVPWWENVIVWQEAVPRPGRFIIGGRWADLRPAEQIEFEIDVEYWTDGPVPRCTARKEAERLVCALWPNHDGPHIAMTEELDLATGGITVVAMRSRSGVRCVS